MSDAPRYLHTFHEVCAAGGFRRAAQRLHLSQPAVSYQVRALEATLGVPLFHRVGRGVVLTEQGALLRDYARRMVGDLAALTAALRAGDPSPAATVRLASVSGFGRYVLFPVLRRLPGVRVELSFPTQEEVVRRVLGGLADAGFVYAARVSPSLHCVPVAREELVLVVARSDRAAARARSRAAVAALPFVTYDESDYVIGRWFETVFGGPAGVTSAAHFEELEEVVAFVEDGRGVSVLPDHCVRNRVRAGALRILRPRPTRRCWNDLFGLTRVGAASPPQVDAVMAALGQGRAASR